jgi:hypothetical protein
MNSGLKSETIPVKNCFSRSSSDPETRLWRKNRSPVQCTQVSTGKFELIDNSLFFRRFHTAKNTVLSRSGFEPKF